MYLCVSVDGEAPTGILLFVLHRTHVREADLNGRSGRLLEAVTPSVAVWYYRERGTRPTERFPDIEKRGSWDAGALPWVKPGSKERVGSITNRYLTFPQA